MADPTGAQMRTINSFWDAPRYAIIELPPLPDAPAATPVPAPAPQSAPLPVPPKLSLFLPATKSRRVKAFMEHGLAFKVTTDKPATDVEVRLFEVLHTGLRPLGAAFRVEPGPGGALLKLEPTAFARGKLKGRGKRTVRAQATATGRDGLVGRTQADFTLR
jgi:hypothetical protein